MFEKLLLEEINSIGKFGNDELIEELDMFTYEFTVGNTYLASASIGQGAWLLSWTIAGAVTPKSGQCHIDNTLVKSSELRRYSWLVRYDEIKRYKLFHQSVKAQIQNGLKKSGNPTHITEDELKEGFRLTRKRYNRPLSHLSSEAWRASCAIGLANGKKVFCFPHMDYVRKDFLKEYRSIWFDDMMSFLKKAKTIVIFPANASEYTNDLFDEIVTLN